jgi:hypothetical protein
VHLKLADESTAPRETRDSSERGRSYPLPGKAPSSGSWPKWSMKDVAAGSSESMRLFCMIGWLGNRQLKEEYPRCGLPEPCADTSAMPLTNIRNVCSYLRHRSYGFSE